MSQSVPPIIDTPLTIEHIRAARWEAQHAKRQGYSIVPMETAQVLQLLALAEIGLATQQEIQH